MKTKINETHLEDVSLIRTGSDSVKISWKLKSKDAKVVIFKDRLYELPTLRCLHSPPIDTIFHFLIHKSSAIGK